MWEEDYFPDGGYAREQHDEAVNAEAHTAGRRQAVLERPHVVGVDPLRLLVTQLFERGLRLESSQLVDRVVELTERIGELATVDDEFETFGQRRVVAVHARER